METTTSKQTNVSVPLCPLKQNEAAQEPSWGEAGGLPCPAVREGPSKRRPEWGGEGLGAAEPESGGGRSGRGGQRAWGRGCGVSYYSEIGDLGDFRAEE